MTFKGYATKLAPIVMGALLSACDAGPDGLSSAFDEAGSSYSSSSSSSSSSSGTSGPTIAISGVAAKGLISDGVVSIHPIVQGVLNTTPVGNSSTTDANGNYNITINNYDGNPFVVRVTTSESTTMRCDLAAGCGDGSSFGDNVPLHETSFNLDAVVPPIPNTTLNTSVNLSVLTDTATDLALDALSSSTDTSLASVSQLVRNANRSVANRFNISGDLTQLPVVDLTNPASLVGVTQDIIEYNLLNVGVVEAMLSGDNTTTIANAVGRFASQYTTQGGLADTETTASTNVTLSEILNRAANVINAIRNRDTENTLDLSQLTSTIRSRQLLAENGSTTPTPGVVDDSIDLSELEKVKAMMAEVRKIGTVLNNGFADEQAIVDAVASTDIEPLMEALSKAASAIGNAYESEATTSFNDAETGITVSFNTISEDNVYSVDTTVATSFGVSVDVTMSANGYETHLDSSTETLDDITARAWLSIQGSAESDVASLTINDGSNVGIIDLDATSVVATEETEVSVSSLTFNLDASLTNFNVEDATSFTGKLLLDVTSLDLAVDASGGETAMANNIGLSLNGKFSTASGASFTAVVSANTSSSGFDFAAEETAEAYAEVGFSAILRLTSLTEVAPYVNVKLDGNRTSLEDGDFFVTVSYDSKTLSTSFNSGTESQTLTISDQAGVKLLLTESINGDVTGTLTLNDTEYGTIGDANGFLAVSYSDNTNETLW